MERYLPILGVFAGVAAVVVVAMGVFGRPPESAVAGTTFSSELYVDATFPVTLAFAPNGDLFYNELCGKVRIVTAAGALLPTPFVDISSDVACQSDFGMTGLALDPQFDANGYVYIFYMHEVSDPPLVARPTLVRYTNVGNVGVDPTIILGDLPLNIPGQKIHGAANIHFGPDDQLYVSLGDLERYDPAAAQDLSTAAGKILRIDSSDGSASPGNPFIGQPGVDERIYAYGLRNSFDFTFGGGRIYATENGPVRCDELNIIESGGNHGWPLPYTGDGSDPWDTSTEVEVTSCTVPPAEDTDQPIYWFRFFAWMDPWDHNSTSAPTAIVYLDGDDYPALGDSLLVCEFRSSALRLLPITGGGEGVIDLLPILGGVDGATTEERAESCRLGLAIAPDGAIYYSNLSQIRKLVIEVPPTPSPTASPPPTPTSTPTPTPTATLPAGEVVVWGDHNCSGSADPIDSLLTLRFVAGLSANTGDCPNFGQVVDVAFASPHVWGDVDCGGDITPVDSLELLRNDAGLGVSQADGCPFIGSEILVVE